ncbi:IS3 family transposase [Dictyobacter aurantiacus]|uniref:IS3 family transposase n=1 Tax=Dictyobacter aurantiacus TaxID=1936993 RepID=UPI000F81DAC1
MTRAFQRKGWSVNHKRVLRVMQEESLLCQPQTRSMGMASTRIWSKRPVLTLPIKCGMGSLTLD